jgi:predicted ribosome quality control (RQC) complex YloA/Tae2 family protein
MNERLISEVVGELRATLVGRAWGRVFQFGRAALVVELRPNDNRYLLLSVEPNRPRLYLVRRSSRELERDSLPPTPFALVLRKRLGGAALVSIEQDEGERVVRLRFDAEDVAGRSYEAILVAQLTGRSSNLFLLDENGRVVDSLRPARGPGQEIGELYAPPAPKALPADAAAQETSETSPAQSGPRADAGQFARAGFETLSEALDAHYLAIDRAKAFEQRARTAAARLRQESAKLTKLRQNLERDLAAHGDAEQHKRIGDLLLANLATAVRANNIVRLIDYYAEDAPVVAIEVDENKSLQEEAAERFARYGKAKRAAQEIARRLDEIETELADLNARQAELERAAAEHDEAALARLTGGRGEGARPDGETRRDTRRSGSEGRAKSSKRETNASAASLRRYRSSDGYEILVGRGSRDNDLLTFRLARSYDLWLHAADYPGSHVVVRARTRDEEIPHRTIIEAAQLAAHFSRAGRDAKVAVNYAPRKLVTKPKGAAPGLVYLTGFRTLLVEPREAGERV